MRRAKTHEDRHISDALLEKLTEGKLLAVILGRWQENRPYLLAKHDIAERIGKSTKSIERALSDKTSLSVLDWLIIEEELGEGPIFDRYVQIQRKRRRR